MHSRSLKSVAALCWLGGMLALLFAQPVSAAPDFVTEVRPILERSCFRCHGPEKQKSGYRLDVREIALKGGDSGRPAIVPHNANTSALIRYISGLDEEIFMPPKKSEVPQLTAAEIQTLRDWINAGPSWPDALAGKAAITTHWSLTALVKPPVPLNQGNPIDAFVQAKLSGTSLSPEAERQTLIRRLNYDLTGLPPSKEEVDAFVGDNSTNAYENLVERLLSSPRYGEHWARHWLDVVNYADTHGNDHDYARSNAWPYRDYVIGSLNADKPYARFVQEQIAGDALFPGEGEATVALGFLAAGPWDHTLMVTVREDTVDHKMAQNLDRDNMVTAAMGTFQSLTVHCARCHDHKFDPITQREYYALQAIFAGVDRANRPYDTNRQVQSARSRLRAEKHELEVHDDRLLAKLDTPEVAEKVARWEQAWADGEKSWKPFEILSVISTGGAALTRQADGSWLASGTRAERDTYIVTARWPAANIRAVRLEVLPDESLPHKGPGRYDNGNFHLTEFRLFAATHDAGQEASAIPFVRAKADFDEGAAVSAAQAIDGKNETWWGVDPRYGEPHEAVFELKKPAEFTKTTTFTFLLENQAGAPGHSIGRFRLAASDADTNTILAPISGGLAKLLRLPTAERTPAQRHEVALAVLQAENQRGLESLPEPQWVYAVTPDFPPDGDNFKPSPHPRPIHLLQRGELSKPGELIAPGTLKCVPGMSSELSISVPSEESTRRAALALWLADGRNALTWRSIVNRVWHYHFGRGICDTPNDFGKMGGMPSHPELLDWLAVWFRDDAKGSLKSLHRLILTSATWKQTSLTLQGLSSDADNRLLWRQNRRRLTGEQVRDTLLAMSGQLDLTMGGPPAIQFISKGDATFNSGGNPAFLDYQHFDPDSPAARRRAIYRFVFRTVPDPFLDALDCPDGGVFTPVRGASTTPQQAFAMLNNPFVIRQCQHIASRVNAKMSEPGKQAEAIFEIILLRQARASEAAKFSAYIERYGLANACQLLVNSSEFLYLD